MFDAHCHLDLCAPERDPADVWARARAAGVWGCVVAGVDPEGWARQAALQLPEVWCTYGLHPWTVAASDESALPALLDALAAALASSPAPVGLGELGLDHGRRGPPSTRPLQERAFRAQLAMARERDLPVVLHVVGAYGKLLELLARDGLPAAGGMIHRYSGPAELVPDLVATGLHLSFSPAILHVPRLIPALRRVPDGRLLLETDAPDTLPAQAGADPIEPASLPRVIARAAEERGADRQILAEISEQNARTLFRLPAWNGPPPAGRPPAIPSAGDPKAR